MTKNLEIGAKAPDFTLPGDSDGTVSLSDFKNRQVVVYFYPKDMTPGCTTQALDFTAQMPEFDKVNTVIVGISGDSAERHDKFKAKHDLTVALAADEDHEITKIYGVWVEKNMYGRKYMGIERATFLIDDNGAIARMWRKVRVKGHVDAVLEAARALAK